MPDKIIFAFRYGLVKSVLIVLVQDGSGWRHFLSLRFDVPSFLLTPGT